MLLMPLLILLGFLLRLVGGLFPLLGGFDKDPILELLVISFLLFESGSWFVIIPELLSQHGTLQWSDFIVGFPFRALVFIPGYFFCYGIGYGVGLLLGH